jgi:hypothetical protein
LCECTLISPSLFWRRQRQKFAQTDGRRFRAGRLLFLRLVYFTVDVRLCSISFRATGNDGGAVMRIKLFLAIRWNFVSERVLGWGQPPVLAHAL